MYFWVSEVFFRFFLFEFVEPSRRLGKQRYNTWKMKCVVIKLFASFIPRFHPTCSFVLMILPVAHARKLLVQEAFMQREPKLPPVGIVNTVYSEAVQRVPNAPNYAIMQRQ